MSLWLEKSGWLAALPFVLSSGCFWAAKDDVDILTRRLDDHDARVGRLENGLKEDVAIARQKLAELESILGRATQVVARNNADLGVQVEELRGQLASMNGKMAEITSGFAKIEKNVDAATQLAAEQRKRLQVVERKSGIELEPGQVPEVPSNKDAHFAAARNAYDAANFAACRHLFREFLKRYANDTQSDEAQYWIGMSYMQQGKPATALAELQKVIRSYSKSDSVDESLYAMGEAFWQLNACTDAKSALMTLMRTKKKSPLVPKARALYKTVKKAPKARCTS